MSRERNLRLIAEPIEDKAWAALVALGGFVRWVSIDEIGDFLRKRQIDAHAVRFDAKDPNSRYALEPRMTKWSRGWEDAVIARALSSAYDHGFVDHGRDEGLNVFRAKKDLTSSLWKLKNTSVPTSPTWALPRVPHVESSS